MIECVIANAMSCSLDHLKLLGVFPHIVANHEESSLDAVMVEHLKHTWSDVGDWAIVKGEVHSPLLRLDSPESLETE